MRLHIIAAAASALCLLGTSAQAAAPKVGAICQADFQKLCPEASAGRGAVMRCVKTRLDSVSDECKAAVAAAQERNAQRKAAKLAAKAGPETQPPQ